jgi:4-aminobutyrate aminotransferase-like enzyme/Ser/Thr protein kinase RdoA (MazF antagonist)
MIFSEELIKEIVKENYQISVNVKSLNGYDDQNFLLKDKNSNKYILKVSTDEHGLEFLDAQIKIINHLSKSDISEKFQHYLENHEHQELTRYVHDGKNYYIRILTFLEGDFWGDCKNLPDNTFVDLGSVLGKMDNALKDFSHTAMHRRYMWDVSNAADANAKLQFIKSHEKRRVAAYFLLQFETEALPVLASLRHAYIHSDANDYNILIKENRVSGIIDFGDSVYTALINNLAIACTYAILNNTNPLKAATLIVKGYHLSHPLQEKEVELLYYLIAARLCISLTQSAWNSSLNPYNEHHFLTEKPGWELLFKLIKINPVKAHNEFRKVCGFSSIISEDDDYNELLADRKKYIGKNLSISYQKPLKIIKGALQYLYDDKGNTFVDCVNNVSHVGHCHPVVVKAMQKQIATLNTNTRYLSGMIVDYAKALTATLPKKLSVCYFVNSGSEANDLAIRMARNFTKQKDIIVLDHAYHGTSTLAIEMSPYKFDGKGGAGIMPYIHKAESPDLYRGQFQYDDKNTGEKYAASVKNIIEDLNKTGKGISAFICETLLGVGGQIPLPENYLKKVYEYVRGAGGVCIADEVQVGFGRVGVKFWGFELQNVEPDIVVLGKPIGNGHPLAAVVVTQEIANAFNNGMEYFNTFGGNPVSMVTGLSVLSIIQQEELQKNAKTVGDILIEGFKKLMQKHFIIGDVRGHGLFVGIELVKDRKTKEPAVPEIDTIVEKMKKRGFLLSTDGPLHNVLKLKPPMAFSEENAEELVKNLDEVLSDLK